MTDYEAFQVAVTLAWLYLNDPDIARAYEVRVLARLQRLGWKK